MTRPKLSLIKDEPGDAAKTLVEAAEEAEGREPTITELRAANAVKVQRVHAIAPGAAVAPIIQTRMEMLIDALIGVGENREKFEYVFEHQAGVVLDEMEKSIQKFRQQQMMTVPGEARTEAGLIVPH